MRFQSSTLLVVLAVIATAALDYGIVEAKKPSSGRRQPSRRGPPPPSSSSSSRSGRSGRPAPVSRRRTQYEVEEEGDDDSSGYSEEQLADDMYDDDEEVEDFMPPPKSARKQKRSRGSSSPRSRPPPRDYDDYDVEEEEDDQYDRPARRSPRPPTKKRGPPPRRSAGRKSGSVVRYSKNQSGGAAAAFTRGLSAIRNSMPDPSSVKEAAFSSIDAARKTTSSLSANIYREVKGLTSSELEQVMLKATKPDDTPVKGKHVERLVGVTYQISARYDIYDAVLRKLWGKMAESDWRTTMKALYILHRFSSDGAPEHAPALKARLRELRRTRDPKRKDKFFNSKQLLAGDSRPENIKFRAFMSRYAHYVLLRTQCFGGMFDEIATLPKPDSSSKKKKAAAPKPMTSTCLRVEHLEAATMLLKAGVVCQLKDGEECENTAIAAERVAADMIGLTTAVATALNRCLKDPSAATANDAALVKRWCLFYSQELLPQSKSMVKKLSPKLDAYGLFLPSRMGASISPELLEKGLNLDGASSSEEESPVSAKEEEEESVEQQEEAKPVEEPEEALDEEAVYDEYEYDEEEYYDDEEE